MSGYFDSRYFDPAYFDAVLIETLTTHTFPNGNRLVSYLNANSIDPTAIVSIKGTMNGIVLVHY